MYYYYSLYVTQSVYSALSNMEPRLNLNVHKNVPIRICQTWLGLYSEECIFSLIRKCHCLPMGIILSPSSHQFATTVCFSPGAVLEVNLLTLGLFFSFYGPVTLQRKASCRHSSKALGGSCSGLRSSLGALLEPSHPWGNGCDPLT